MLDIKHATACCFEVKQLHVTIILWHHCLLYPGALSIDFRGSWNPLRIGNAAPSELAIMSYGDPAGTKYRPTVVGCGEHQWMINCICDVVFCIYKHFGIIVSFALVHYRLTFGDHEVAPPSGLAVQPLWIGNAPPSGLAMHSPPDWQKDLVTLWGGGTHFEGDHWAPLGGSMFRRAQRAGSLGFRDTHFEGNH